MAKVKSNEQPQSFAELFETRSGLFEWWFWVVLLSAVCAIIAILWRISGSPAEANAVVGGGLYAIMATIAAICFYKSLQAIRFLMRETKLASEQVRILERVDTFDEFFHESSDSVFRLHIENLHTISEKHPDVDQDHLIEILHQRLMAKNRGVELFSGILVTIGLIGTMVGLIFMMDGLSDTIQKQQAGGSLVNILFAKDGGPMGGLGTAFYTTLVGATLGGVVFRILTSVVDEHITRYVSHVAELTAVYVLPAMRSQSQNAIRL